MFGKTLLRSLAGSTVVGTVLAGAALAAPASSIAPMSCNAQYQHSVVTQTRLTLNRSTGEFFSRNVVHVLVTSDSGLVPTGRVRISSGVRTWTVPLDVHGYAQHRLNRHLQAGNTYKITARYLPGCSDFGRSHAAPHFYTVTKASTQVLNLDARNIARGQHPVVSLDVASSTGRVPWGHVRVRLFHHSQLRAVKTVRLRHGHHTVWFRRIWQRRHWHVTVVYLGNHNFERAYSDTSFWVRRR